MSLRLSAEAWTWMVDRGKGTRSVSRRGFLSYSCIGDLLSDFKAWNVLLDADVF